MRDGPRSPPVPLETAAVERALLPFGRSRMLPAAAYLDAEVLGWERHHLIDGWVCAGRAEHVVEPTAQRAVALGTGSVLLVRAGDGTLRAFENACRHRGHELLPCGTGTRRPAVVCPYHSWSYRLDGRLRVAPGFQGHTDFEPLELGLREMPIVDWHGWLFVDPSRQAGAFADRVADLEPVVSAYGASALATAVTHVYEVEANWKVVIENFQECYHCSTIHPELCRVSQPHSGENLTSAGDWMGGWMSLSIDAATMSIDGRSGGVVIGRLDEHEQRTVMYVAVLPNLLLSLHPDYVMSHVLTPVAPGLTRVECSWAFPSEAVAREGFDPAYAVDFWDLTNRQDRAACESVQRGMASRSYEPGPLAPVEDGVYQFVTWVARHYRG